MSIHIAILAEMSHKSNSKCNAAALDKMISDRQLARKTLPLVNILNWTRNCSDGLLSLSQLPKSACFSQKVSQGTTPD